MAADWIKMRVDLQTHPKVVRILSAMRPHDVQTITDKFRVIGGLHAVWSVFDTHSVDGVLYGYTPDTLDHIIGWEGFAAAMMQVDWLHFDDKETLTLPEFTEHNGQSAKRRAEDQKRKKNGRHSVRNLSADDADKKRTREEKRREDKETPIVPLPECVSAELWADLVQHRKAIGKPMTDQAKSRMLAKLEKLAAAGVNLTEAVDATIRNGWQDVFAPKPGSAPPSSACKPWDGAL